jgi:CotH kinase protein/Lamin Tail Domain/Chitobiase/beta-hexosaminidase C-terminal domain/Secretion system C-terminal sorting domain
LKKIIFFLVTLFFLVSGYAQHIAFNEIMASNTTVVADEDGDYPDWIEITNTDSTGINIGDWGISDSRDNPFKWVFPDVTLTANQFLVIFASGKDRREWIPWWHTIIEWGDSWHYFPGKSQPASDWIEAGFDDASWSFGNSGFGYGDNDDQTDFSVLGLAPLYSVYIRKTFQIEDKQKVVSGLLHIDYDDAFVAYINGVEFARANIGEPGIEPSFNQGADNYDHEAHIYHGGQPELFVVENIKDHIVNGENVLAIQVHNFDLGSSDMTCIPFFSIGMNYLPDDPLPNPAILNLDAPGSLHSNFKIDASGETLYLSNSDSVLIDSIHIAALPTDHSYGRKPDGNGSWFYFAQSTPGAANTTPAYLQLAEEPLFSIEDGFYDDPVELMLQNSHPKYTTYYTLDGSIPNEQSYRYSGPVQIDTTTVVRAVTMSTGMLPSAVITKNYIIGDHSNLPIICLTTAPQNLWDNENGIYVLGDNYEDALPYYGANYWQDWEKPVHIAMYENDGDLAFSIDGGVKIFGSWSRARPQKSLALFARSRYGYPKIGYPLFENRPFNEYTSFVLRNAGNDWGRTMFTDGLIQTLAEPLDLEHQAYRPCVVYINGVYFSLMNMREKVNEDFLAMYHDVNPGNLDILESGGSPVEGNSDHYDHMLDYISSHDMSLEENYSYISSQMDIDNFIEYQAFQIYIDNRDWPGNNIKFWRPREEKGRWRWILYDTEWGFGINAYGSAGNAFAYDYNTLAFATSPSQTPNHHANPPWATFLLRSLLQNETFKNKFINRFADQMNTIFKSDHVLQVIDSLETNIESEMPFFYEKWSQTYWWYSFDKLYWGSYEDWYYFNNIARDFARYRPGHMRQYIMDKFNLSAMGHLVIDINETHAGRVQINSIKPVTYPWIGEYFIDVPLELKAVAAPGYQFERWTGAIESESQTLLYNFSSASSITAHFKKVPLPSTLVINEINYNSAENFNPQDWIEIYYDGNNNLDISGWLFKDERDTNVFVFPQSTILSADQYYVLCRDTSAFKSFFPDVENIFGNFNFGLDGSNDQIRLFNSENKLIDSVSYNDSDPWPLQADGTGPTLELKNPYLDNSAAYNWAASNDHGSPGAVNSIFTAIKEENTENLPDEFILQQNYPNPFNPLTTISYFLPRPADITLTVYNILGQKIIDLASGKQSAGYHKVLFDAGNFSSGVYFCRLQADNNIVKYRKLVLLK